VVLLLALAARQHHLLGVDHDHVVAVVDVGREAGLMLAAQAHRDDGREPPDDEALGVDQKPLLLDVGRLGRMGFAEHGGSVKFSGRGLLPCAERIVNRRREESPRKLAFSWLRYYDTASCRVSSPRKGGVTGPDPNDPAFAPGGLQLVARN